MPFFGGKTDFLLKTRKAKKTQTKQTPKKYSNKEGLGPGEVAKPSTKETKK